MMYVRPTINGAVCGSRPLSVLVLGQIVVHRVNGTPVVGNGGILLVLTSNPCPLA